MIEVFKTNVDHPSQASMLTNVIHLRFDGYLATFDLEDCDRILRIESRTDTVSATALVELLREFGFRAEVLSDDQPALH